MSIIKGIKVGTTDIISTYVDVESESDSKTLTVVAERITVISKPEDTSYTGYPQEPQPIVKAIVNGEETILTNNIDYELSYLNNTDSGTATVIANGIGNFVGNIQTTWTINKVDINVLPNDYTSEYNGEYKGNPVEAYTVNNQPTTIKYGIEPDVYNLDSAPQIKNVVDSKTIYYQVSAPNHNTMTGSYELIVTPKIAEFKWGESSWVYDGVVHNTTCVVNNLVGDDVCDVTLSGNSIKEIGKMTVTVTSLSNSNYQLSSDSVTHIIEVYSELFIKVSGIWTPVKKVYKKVSGTWVEQEMNASFMTASQGGRYLKKS